MKVKFRKTFLKKTERNRLLQIIRENESQSM